MSELDEVVSEFLVESYENLDRLDQDLLALERAPGDRELLASIFRTVHSVKGTCGFLGFGKLERLAHAGENLLGKLRDGELRVTPEIATALLATGDAIRSMLATIEATGGDGDDDHDELVATLTRLQDADAAAEDGEAQQGAERAHERRLGELLVEGGATTDAEVMLAAHEQELGDERLIGEILVGAGGAEQGQVDKALQRQGSAIADNSIRVDVGLLDQLMNLVGELVLARNQMLQLGVRLDDPVFAGASQRLNLITSELQEGVMKTRMQPIGSVWSRFPRVVRDVANDCGKRVRVEMEGEETELDKTIIEAIKDPLTHLVRNAVDHGIESPDVRRERGKPEEGCLSLRAFHEGGQVNVEIADDGKGLDPAALREKAVAKGLLGEQQAAALSDRDAVHLIFEPGFSTAPEVTSLSGRGVGMDVVKTNVERIGGTVDVHSEPGVGTTFRVKIPLTLAIIPALIVTCAGERFAIPQVGLLELVRLEADQVQGAIEMIHGTPVYRLRGRLLPLVDLAGQLDLAGDGDGAGAVSIVVLQTERQPFGLVVDEVNDTQEIVVKPLGKQVRDVPVFAGATIMGDGRVALILDVLGVAGRAGLLGEQARVDTRSDEAAAAEGDERRRSLLVVEVGERRRAAVPLSEVARLEVFPADALEYVGHRQVVQYRGGILPLVRLADALGVAAYDTEERDSLDVVVYRHRGHDIGVLVGRILDVVEQRDTGEDGGTAVLQGRVTELVDLADLVRGVLPEGTAPELAGVS